MGILGELDRAGLINRDVPNVHARTLGEAIDRWDIVREHDVKVHEFFKAARGRAHAGCFLAGSPVQRA
jgi:dihydroxy-acid dehydratase